MHTDAIDPQPVLHYKCSKCDKGKASPKGLARIPAGVEFNKHLKKITIGEECPLDIITAGWVKQMYKFHVCISSKISGMSNIFFDMMEGDIHLHTRNLPKTTITFTYIYEHN